MDKDLKAIFIRVGLSILLLLLIFFGGFFIGRNTIEIKEVTVTEYIKGDTIRDTVKISDPIEVKAKIDTIGFLNYCLNDPVYRRSFEIVIKDTVIQTIAADTSSVLLDWVTERSYSEVLFDTDSTGKCEVDLGIKYNKLTYLDYSYIPVIKSTVIEKEKRYSLEPFIGGGFTVAIDNNRIANPGAILQGGLYFNENYGVSVTYQYLFGSLQNQVISAQLLYKF
jgi:hypothetical protein